MEEDMKDTVIPSPQKVPEFRKSLPETVEEQVKQTAIIMENATEQANNAFLFPLTSLEP